MIGQLLSKLPASRPADWGSKVTVCIGALCENRKVVIAATDMLATLGLVASDVGVFKNEVIFPRWVAMTAGDDTEHIDAILNRTRALLSRKIEHKTPEEVAVELVQAYSERLQELITLRVLSRYRFTPNTFRDHGKKRLTASVYNALASRIAAIKIRLSFLVCGFDRSGVGHILGIHGEEPAVSYDKLGYWAIGDGASMALASLGFFNHRPRLGGELSLEECLYQVCAAKFMAESIGTVGRQTHIAIYGPEDGVVRFVYLSDLETIRKAWDDEGAQRVPSNILNKIPGMLVHPSDPNFRDKIDQKVKEWQGMVAANPAIFRR
jgi:hypothetical protein